MSGQVWKKPNKVLGDFPSMFVKSKGSYAWMNKVKPGHMPLQYIIYLLFNTPRILLTRPYTCKKPTFSLRMFSIQFNAGLNQLYMKE